MPAWECGELAREEGGGGKKNRGKRKKEDGGCERARGHASLPHS
jgi:hypothetical protein